jgi:hypothetical protein
MEAFIEGTAPEEFATRAGAPDLDAAGLIDY